MTHNLIHEEDAARPKRTPGELKRDAAVFGALLWLEPEPGLPFKTTRAAMFVEANVRPITLDASLYRLERDGYIEREGKRGTGTTIRILKRPPAA